jgi:hypothetical protein
MVVLIGVLGAWACEYATSGAPLALCKLRLMMAAKIGTVLEELLRGPGAHG